MVRNLNPSFGPWLRSRRPYPNENIFQLISFVKPYWKKSLVALTLLTAVVFMDLAIPRLIQRVIDQGIAKSNMTVVIQTTLWMLGISLLSAILPSVTITYRCRLGSVARDLREALFLKSKLSLR